MLFFVILQLPSGPLEDEFATEDATAVTTTTAAAATIPPTSDNNNKSNNNESKLKSEAKASYLKDGAVCESNVESAEKDFSDKNENADAGEKKEVVDETIKAKVIFINEWLTMKYVYLTQDSNIQY